MNLWHKICNHMCNLCNHMWYMWERYSVPRTAISVNLHASCLLVCMPQIPPLVRQHIAGLPTLLFGSKAVGVGELFGSTALAMPCTEPVSEMWLQAEEMQAAAGCQMSCCAGASLWQDVGVPECLDSELSSWWQAPSQFELSALCLSDAVVGWATATGRPGRTRPFGPYDRQRPNVV